MVLPLIAGAAAAAAVEAAGLAIEIAEVVGTLVRLGISAYSHDDKTINVDVESSFIQGLTYGTDTHDLTVIMLDGRYGPYVYPGVDMSTFEAFAAAGSPGQFYNFNVKLGHRGRLGSKGASAKLHNALQLARTTRNIASRRVAGGGARHAALRVAARIARTVARAATRRAMPLSARQLTKGVNLIRSGRVLSGGVSIFRGVRNVTGRGNSTASHIITGGLNILGRVR